MLMKITGDLSEKEFYIRSLTCGLLTNIAGGALALGMMATGHKPKKYSSCIEFDVGEGWGGASVGMFMFVCRDADEHLKAHELGHSIQNCYYGPLMPFIVNLPSSSRFLFRKVASKLKPDMKFTPYESAWFEAEASALGEKYVERSNSEQKHD